MQDEKIQRLALQLTYHCVRNTVIEDYHADGKLSNAEIEALNKEVANKLYTALRYILGRGIRHRVGYRLMRRYWDETHPEDWDIPKIDESIEATVLLGVTIS